MKSQTATKELIKAATVNRVSDKQGQVLGYLVKSNSNDDYYMVTGSKVNRKCSYFCNCKAGANAFRNCKDGKCAHVKAVIEVVEAKRELVKEAEIARASTFLALKAQYDVREQEEVNPPAIVTLGEAITEAVESMSEVIEEAALSGDVSYVEAIEKSLDATYAELAAVKAANKEREERETAKAWREYHDMPY